MNNTKEIKYAKMWSQHLNVIHTLMIKIKFF